VCVLVWVLVSDDFFCLIGDARVVCVLVCVGV